MQISVSHETPPMGVFDDIIGDRMPPVERFRFWLQSHNLYDRERLWKSMVLKECLPTNIEETQFETIGLPLFAKLHL